METVRWGFIGCGEVTEKKSGPAFSAVEGSEVVAVMSRRAEKAQIVRRTSQHQTLVHRPPTTHQRPRCQRHIHCHSTIDPRHLRHHGHEKWKGVYVEKPMASNYEDCCRINRIAEKHGTPCFVAYYRRYLPYFQKVRELVESGAVGNVVNVQIRFAVPPRDLDYNQKICLGAYSPTLPEAVTFTI